MNRGHLLQALLRNWIILVFLLGPASISPAAAAEDTKPQTEWVTGSRKQQKQSVWFKRTQQKYQVEHLWLKAIAHFNRSIRVQYTTWRQQECIFIERPLLLTRIPKADEPNLIPTFIL